MKKAGLPLCKIHPDQRLLKFCKNLGCWTRLCSKCVVDFHRGHQVVEYTNLSNEARSVKEKLLQARKGDLISLKRILSNVSKLETQLKEAEERRKEDKKLAETHLLSKLQKVAEDESLKFGQLSETLRRLQKALSDTHESQAQEVAKIPELADAVISQGTMEDLRTFFEMCQQGVESNSEIYEYKRNADSLREGVQRFASQSPFDFAFRLDDSITLSQLPETSLNSERSLKETLSRTLTSKELPVLKTQNPPPDTKGAKSATNGRHTRIKSAAANDFSSLASTSMTTRNVSKISANLTHKGMPSKRLTSSRASLCDTLNSSRVLGPSGVKTSLRKPVKPVKKPVKKEQGRAKQSTQKVEKLKAMKRVVEELKNRLKMMVKEVKERAIISKYSG